MKRRAFDLSGERRTVKRRPLGLSLAVASALALGGPTLAARSALAAPSAHDADAIDRTAADARGGLAFCREPARPLAPHARELCTLAREAPDCAALVKACDEAEAVPETRWLAWLVSLLAPVATVLLYLLVLAIVVAVAIPVIVALRRRSREAKPIAPADLRHAVVLEEPAAAAPERSPEELLAEAEVQRRAGALDRALGLYLAASLRALARRDALIVAEHRTNGEYVRGCKDAEARPSLRAIVTEVDRVAFGGSAPTAEALDAVAQRAIAIVRRVATLAASSSLLALTMTLTLLVAGCGGHRQAGADPAGDELPREVLRKNGYRVARLQTSLATLPIPGAHDATPTILLDVERVPLEPEASAHLARWVEAGGVLVIFGPPRAWPAIAPKPRSDSAGGISRDLEVITPDPNHGLEDLDADAPPPPNATFGPVEVRGARLGRAAALAWDNAEPLAFTGDHRIYAAMRPIGRGLVLAVANDDLITNIGQTLPRNSAALVALVRAATHDSRRAFGRASEAALLGDLRIAEPEDAVPPPASPFAALAAAGLGKGAWHALVAALLLFLAAGVRHARARPEAPPARRAFVEHVEATGALYRRAGRSAHPHALAAYGRFAELRLHELTRLRGGLGRTRPATEGTAELLAAETGTDPRRVGELLARARKASTDAASGDELTLLKELIDLVGRLGQHTPSASKHHRSTTEK